MVSLVQVMGNFEEERRRGGGERGEHTDPTASIRPV